jgi:D-methionine transport system ATP-binding protein
VLRIVFAGPQADQPVLTRIARIVSTDMNILAGQIEAIGGQPFGTMVVAVSNDAATLGAVQASLARLDLDTELVGYVP